MAEKEHEKKELEIDGLEVTELEDEDLEDVAGGSGRLDDSIENTGCPNTNCPC